MTTPVPDPRASLLAALAARAPESQRARVLALASQFGPELDRYAELIVCPGGEALGFMTRGEGPGFTEKVAATLAALGLPEGAREHHARLARWFEHLRGFAKFEWHGEAGSPMAAVYFRRRPPVEAALARLGELGVAQDVRATIGQVAAALDKTSIHFVSAAFSPSGQIQHKVYFSQLVLEERKLAIEERLARVLALCGLSEHALRFLPVHRQTLAWAHETTIYLSLNFTSDQVLPTVKLDYPELGPAAVAQWAAPAARVAVEAESDAVAQAMGGSRLAYLGVRLDAGKWPPRLKYYADQHGAAAT